MENSARQFKNVSLLVTHYNRSRSLERLLNAFRDLSCSFGEVIVSDDGSREEHVSVLREIQQRFFFKLVTAPVNRGLGNNINKGQDGATLPYTLYVQEDFEPSPVFPEHFADALAMMEKDRGLEIARFYAYFSYPYTKPYGQGFSEMVFHGEPWYTNHLKFYFYSDHPHLRRSDFFSRFGRYAEGVSGDRTEYLMSLSFIRHKARGISYDAFTTLFHQKNSPDEPSTMGRSDWRQSKNPLVLTLRHFYLKIKFLRWSFDLLSKKP
ncbi:glycosyltransferase [Sediminibacterium soli]|uniref:glycosyltransferase n=1 Tax=Sediminibacterium soli TaxID=2698829 RepID=UPI00137A5C71|nr:glycosyltransferase [Sediminibacterium soli]NCI45556.1 glycosyltransferase family 2 protein [Sediminibacterium soli]